jgi:cation-transporting P-type ATPase 13A2
MILGPAHWVKHLMQLTKISWDFKLYIIGLGMVYVGLAWIGENYVFQPLARTIGRVKAALTKRTKKRKEYKVILEAMRAQ